MAVAMSADTRTEQFLLELIKPSRYDDDGYVVQWWRAWIPSNTLACMFAVAREADQNKVLGANTSIAKFPSTTSSAKIAPAMGAL